MHDLHLFGGTNCEKEESRHCVCIHRHIRLLHRLVHGYSFKKLLCFSPSCVRKKYKDSAPEKGTIRTRMTERQGKRTILGCRPTPASLDLFAPHGIGHVTNEFFRASSTRSLRSWTNFNQPLMLLCHRS